MRIDTYKIIFHKHEQACEEEGPRTAKITLKFSQELDAINELRQAVLEAKEPSYYLYTRT